MNASSVPELVTLPLSHFCEKARWALERGRVAFVEIKHAPFFHVRSVRRAGGTRQVPVLTTPDRVIADSTEILHWIDAQLPGHRRLFPENPAQREEVVALERQFDDVVGPGVRRIMYSLLQHDRRAMVGLITRGTPVWEGRVLRAIGPVVVSLMRRALRLDPKTVERSRAKLEAVLAEVDARVSDGRKYLVGDTFTAADLTFASLMAPLVCAPEYGGVDLNPAGFAENVRSEVDRARARPSGQFALRLYREERGV